MISVIVLAAGTSSRLGRPKQLLDLGGKPMLQHVVDAAARAGLDEVLVIVGHAAEEVTGAVRLPSLARFVHNPDYAQGQSTSLRAGLREAGPTCRAALVLLGDQPTVRPDAIAAVAEAWRRGDGLIVQASYEGWAAHPSLFHRSVWPELERLAADEGARSVLAAHPDWLRRVEVGGLPPDDIDTEEGYERMKAEFGKA